MELRRNANLYFVPHGEDYIIYAPMAGRAALVNGRCAEEIRSYVRSGDPDVLDEGITKQLGGLDWLAERTVPIPLPIDRHYHPVSATLFVTNACNLRCTYCYAEAGDFGRQVMPPEIFRAAIDLVTSNARRAGRPPSFGFHGGGEPTTAWDTLNCAVEYARFAAGAGSGSPQFAIATNGVMSDDQAQALARSFSTITLSFDGPRELQDAQRPRVDGSGTYDDVLRFLQAIRGEMARLAIRATITERSSTDQADLVDFFVDQTGCLDLHFEPAFPSGRQRRSSGRAPSPEAFASGFSAARQRATKRGVTLRYSAARLGRRSVSFCGCAEDAFNVTPEGAVTGCFEVCRSEDPYSKYFYFGHFDETTRSFAVDYDRLAALRAMTVANKSTCERCFARWSCIGDCPLKAMKGSAGEYDGVSPRCRANRAITKTMLIESLGRKEPE